MKALISSIFTPKPMESKNLILRLFRTLPVLLAEAELSTKLMTNFSSKKAIGLTVSHYSHCLMRMKTDEHWNTTGIFLSSACSAKSSLLISLATPWRPRGALLRTIMVEREQGNQILMREGFLPGISDTKSAVPDETAFVTWTNLIMSSTINSSKPTKELQVGFLRCVHSCELSLTQNVSETIPETWIFILFSRIGYQIPLFAGFCIMFVSTISKCPHLIWSGPDATFK